MVLANAKFKSRVAKTIHANERLVAKRYEKSIVIVARVDEQ